MTRTLNTIPDEAAPLKAAKKSKSSNAKSILAAAATERVPALIWAMAPWKEKLAAKKSA